MSKNEYVEADRSGIAAGGYVSGFDSDGAATRTATKTARRRYRKISLDQLYVCVICGDEATSYNFGAITCESCKAFFRRNSSKNDLLCANDARCTITTSTRKFCPACRLSKCLAVGMCKDALTLANEAARQKRSNMKRKATRIAPPPAVHCNHQADEAEPNVGSSYRRRMGESDYEAALSACHVYVAIISSQATVDESKIYFADADSPIKTYSYAEFLLRRFIRLLKKVDEFGKLERATQINILKANVLNCQPINSGYFFDVDSHAWSIYCEDGRFFRNYANVVNAAFERQSSQPFARYMQKYIEFHTSVKRRFVDWPIIMAGISLANLFYVDQGELTSGQSDDCKVSARAEVSNRCGELPAEFSALKVSVVSSSAAPAVELSAEERELCRIRRVRFVDFLHDYTLRTASDFESTWNFVQQKLEDIRVLGSLLEAMIKVEVNTEAQLCRSLIPLIAEIINIQ